MTGRLMALSGLVLAGAVAIHASVPETPRVTRAPLAQLPAAVGSWRLAGDLAIDEESLKILNADDYVSRLYARGSETMQLFVAYYATQRQGDTMHSPMNCLPASGWEPLQTDRIQMSSGAASPVNANRVVIQKGLDKELVVYWYQSHGRTIASEYASKFYLVLDSIRQHRSDAALIRLVTPIGPHATASTEAAADFVRSLRPLLGMHVPD